MKRHVDFVSWLYFAWGIIFLLVALAGGALSAGAFAISSGSGPAVASPVAARFTAVSLLVLSGIALFWAALHIWIGRALGAYRPSARLMALGLAVVNLVLLPFGTALGAYALWVLLKEEGRKLFTQL